MRHHYAASATSCILEQYTIALTGLGVEVLPNTTLATAYAKVTNSDGTAKSGAAVTLTLAVAEADDGHPAGQHTASHIGSLTPAAGTTGADGKFGFTFAAPAAGGVHTITATCTGCANNPVTGTITVPTDQYTLALDIPAGDIEPSGTAAGGGNTSKAITARVTNVRTQQPKGGARVQLKVDVEAGTGGHEHNENRPKGSV